MTYFNKYHDLKVKYIVKEEDGIVIAQFETPKAEETILCLKDFTQKYFKTSILEEIEDVAYIPGYRFTDLEVRIDNLVGIAYLNKEHDTFNVRFGKYLAKEKLYRKLWTRASNQYPRRALRRFSVFLPGKVRDKTTHPSHEWSPLHLRCRLPCQPQSESASSASRSRPLRSDTAPSSALPPARSDCPDPPEALLYR